MTSFCCIHSMGGACGRIQAPRDVAVARLREFRRHNPDIPKLPGRARPMPWDKLSSCLTGTVLLMQVQGFADVASAARLYYVLGGGGGRIHMIGEGGAYVSAHNNKGVAAVGPDSLCLLEAIPDEAPAPERAISAADA